MKREDLPDRGFVFWPVGNGDSVTILLGEDLRVGHEAVIQVDLHHMSQAEDADDPKVPVIDMLAEILPTGDDGRPYLSVFLLTHPDQDHCRGFADLLGLVTIGELWFTPRVFREAKGDLCDDAVAFRKEAHRRVTACGGVDSELSVAAGDRVRVVGYDELFEEEPYDALPATLRSFPGQRVSFFDGYDYAGTFSVFIHAPFKDDCDGERNDTSLAIQATLEQDGCTQRALLLGDLAHDVLSNIFARSKAEDLAWNLLLAPHHCSKHAVFDTDGNVCDDVVEGFDNNMQLDAWVVSSSKAFPDVDEAGANPPHRSAREQYIKMVTQARFVTTAEHGDADAPDPVVFGVGADCGYRKPITGAAASALGVAVAQSRPRSSPSQPRRYG